MVSGIFKHSYKTKTRESLPIAIYNSGVQQCAPGYVWGPGVRDHFLIHQVVTGHGSYTSNGQIYPIQPGDSFIVYPQTVVSYAADEQDPWEYCWVGFNGADARILMAQTPFSTNTPVVRFADPQMIRQAIIDIYEASGTTPASELRAIGMLYLFLAILVDQPQVAAVGDLSLEYVESAIRFIAHNYSRDIDVSDIAASVGISRSHLYRVFMRHICSSPNDYLTHFRILQACELLRGSNLPISAVSASVGYDDPLYFSRVFKKIIQKSPSQFIKDERSFSHGSFHT